MSALPSERVRTPAVAELLSHAFDYAGLYPPAALTMDVAAREFAAQRNGAYAWALGRFVVSAGQLEAFTLARQAFGGAAWPISVLVAQNQKLPDLTVHAELFRVDAVETKAATVDEVRDLALLKAVAPELYVELPTGTGLEPLIDAVNALGARAKIRTGGVTQDAIPPAASVARFIVACVGAGVPFKATAGLHHLVRGEYALTYEPGSAKATMFGFLNVFVASALASRGVPFDTLVQLLEERDVRAFTVSGESGDLCWQDRCLTSSELRAAHERAMIGIGSCSFSEPIAELVTSGLLGSA